MRSPELGVDYVRRAKARLAQRLAAPPRGMRPVRPAQLHLTLHFLGDTVGLRSEAIPADRFILSDSRKRDGATEHAVAATFSLGPHGRAVEA
jgi:hypothetical protein